MEKDLQKCLPSSGFFLFHNIQSWCSKIIIKKKEIECEVVEFDHVSETNADTDFKIGTVNNFPMPFNEFYDISEDSFKNMVDKYVVHISINDEEINILNILPKINNLVISGGSIEEKNPQHLIFTLQLLIK